FARTLRREPALLDQRAHVVGLDALLEGARADARERGRPPPEEMLVAVLPADLEAQAQRLDARPGPAVRQRHVGEAEQAGELQVRTPVARAVSSPWRIACSPGWYCAVSM